MIYRLEVRSRPSAQGIDPQGEPVRQQIADFGFDSGPIQSARVFFIETDANRAAVERMARELIADPIVETWQLIDKAPADTTSRIEVHLKPGVMDPVATSTEMAIRDMGLPVTQVRTGRAYVLGKMLSADDLKTIATRILANGVIESVHFECFLPASFSKGHEQKFEIRRAKILDLDDEGLKKLSREGHLFLSLTEMKAVQDYFRAAKREPTDIELETLAQTWSEHCVHKTLKSAVEVVDESGKVVRTYKNLIKETIFGSTQELIKRRNDGFCLSVFKDNAGVIKFDDQDAVCFKVETHNRPSAIEPYGGAATGAGGCIRDVLGTGLGAKPIANTDIFCVAYPERKSQTQLPPGVIHPKRILQQVVAGVRDYGNRMGIPTVNGAVYFDDNYVGNPLVFCGCVGIIPNRLITKETMAGDAIVVMGGRTGRDGIHGATFSSAELTDKHSDEFSHAVQIGNAIEQKRMMDVLLQARDRGLYSALTDCGAGGLSSAVGEMGGEIGATVTLEKVPLKYAGLRYDEIWISEAQERMVLSVPQKHIAELLKLAESEDVEATVIGTFGTPGAELILSYNSTEVGRMKMEFLHDGIPMPTRRAVISTKQTAALSTPHSELLSALSHPNIASKHWIIRQYDHEVQGGSVVKPLVGPMQIGPSDASVIRPKLAGNKGVILSCGLAPHVADPYEMAIAAIDEAIRNAVCVGADLDNLAILDNFCWPGTDNEESMGKLVRTCEACRDAALAYGVPFISGKDSLHNQFTNSATGQVIRIPPTLLISAMGVIQDFRQCVTMDFKANKSRVVLIRAKQADLKTLPTVHRTMSHLIAQKKFAAVHDVSEGGYAVAVAEMCIASGIGVITSNDLMSAPGAFAETLGSYVAELRNWDDLLAIQSALSSVADVVELGITQHLRKLTITTTKERVTDISIEDMTKAWRKTLDW